MNAPVIPSDGLAAAREEVFRQLGTVAHYCDCARAHLEVGDDAVVVWDVSAARTHFLAALDALKPIRAAMRARTNEKAEERRADRESAV